MDLIIQKVIYQSTLVNLPRQEYSQELHYSPFTVKLDRCVGSCNTCNYLKNMGLIKNYNVSIQHINLYEFSEAIVSIIKCTPIQILNCLQKLINNLLNLQTTYSAATNKGYQNFITDIIKLK